MTDADDPAPEGGLGSVLPGGAAGRVAAAYLAGVLLARVLSPLFPVGVGPLSLPLTALALPVLFVLAPGLAVRPGAFGDRSRAAVAAATGVLGDELVYVAVRADGVGYWSLPSVAGSVALAAVAVGVVAVAVRGRGGSPPPISSRFAALLAGIVGASFAGFRLSQEYLRATGVPNESRSLVLWGHEIHHGTGGSLVLLVGAIAVATRGLGRRSHRVAALAVAVGCGFVADQYPYLFYAPLTDAAYFTPLSIVGGLVTTVTIMVVVWYHARMATAGDERATAGSTTGRREARGGDERR